jgi:hypothetical protein
MAVGVAMGVFCDEDIAEPLRNDRLADGTSSSYSWPSSPGAKVSVEQNPSDDVMSKVDPSVDLGFVSYESGVWDGFIYQDKSVKVAQCKLLTTHNGVCCCVSYNRTESSVATAYTIRYGRENAIVGPCDATLVSTSKGFGFGDEVGRDMSLLWGISGGGSMVLS